jgi:hypothetical protein
MNRSKVKQICGIYFEGPGGKYSGSYGYKWMGDYALFFFGNPLYKKFIEHAATAKLPSSALVVDFKFKGLAYKALKLNKQDSVKMESRLKRLLSNQISDYATTKKRQSRLLSQSKYHTKTDIYHIWRIQNGRCYFSNASLGESIEGADFQVDHIRPLSSGGDNGPLNLALVSTLINQKKSNSSKQSFIKTLKLLPSDLKRIKSIDTRRRKFFRSFDRIKRDHKMKKRSLAAEVNRKRLSGVDPWK